MVITMTQTRAQNSGYEFVLSIVAQAAICFSDSFTSVITVEMSGQLSFISVNVSFRSLSVKFLNGMFHVKSFCRGVLLPYMVN